MLNVRWSREHGAECGSMQCADGDIAERCAARDLDDMRHNKTINLSSAAEAFPAAGDDSLRAGTYGGPRSASLNAP